MTLSIAVTGKGGVGKTTISSLLVKALHEKTHELILAVDADPNANFHEALGVDTPKSVGDIREDVLKIGENLPPEQSRSEYLDGLINSSICEGEGFDLLSMGRPEGPGCYCYVNNLLRKIVDNLSEKYHLVVMDAEAGLEHFSRRTTKDVDILLVVSDSSARGLMTAQRIKNLISELNTNVGRIFLIVNRVKDSLADKVSDEASKVGIEVIALIPEDDLVQQFDFEGKSLTSLPEDSIAYQNIKKLADKILATVNTKSTKWWEKV